MLLVTNETIIFELKKGSEYGCRMLVRKFYESGRKAIAAFYGIQYSDTGPIVNKALQKIINKIDTINYKTEAEFKAYIYKTIFTTALDFLRKNKREKDSLRNQDIQFISISSDTIFNKYKDDIIDDVNDIEIDISFSNDNLEAKETQKLKSNFDELTDEAEDVVFDISNIGAEFEFFCDTETISTDKKNKLLEELFDSYSPDDCCYLRMHLMGVSHKEIAKIKGSNPDATRKYINRLIKNFLMLASKKLNKNFNELYENFKKQNKRASTK